MMLLREAMAAYAINWKEELSPEWQDLLGGIEPEVTAIPGTIELCEDFPIVPSRRDLNSESQPGHTFKAFEGLSPNRVRVVVLGQDPYPSAEKATGRSFEVGGSSRWSDPLRPSMAKLFRSVFGTREDLARFADPKVSWYWIRKHIASLDNRLETPHECFERWQRCEGVLWLNSALTITRFKKNGLHDDQKAHLAFWYPVIKRILTKLAARPGRHLVILALGHTAQEVIDKIENEPNFVGWGPRVAIVRYPHPRRPGYLRGNPFLQVNQKLNDLGERKLNW
jgi:uracil-DNA glycosylase